MLAWEREGTGMVPPGDTEKDASMGAGARGRRSL